MKSQELLEVIGEAQDEYILDARESKQKGTPAWKKWTALAACICLFLSVVWFFRLTATTAPDYPSSSYSAYDIANLFPKKDAVATNAYTKVYVPSSEYLQLNPIPEADTLPIYRYDGTAAALPDRKKYESFASRVVANFCDALNVPVPDYVVEEAIIATGMIGYDLSPADGGTILQTNQFWLHSEARRDYTRFSLVVLPSTFDSYDPTIRLNGHAVQADQHRSDQEILDSLEDVKEELFKIYGVSFSDAKISRYYQGYSQYGVTYLTVYYYDEDAHPLNAYSDRPVSDYIEIHFDNMMNFDGDIVSNTILSHADIEYWDYSSSPQHLYPQIANGNMISLAEAEELLYKGYVFGGHSCPLCMAEQEEISFEGYDYVGLEYVFGYNKDGTRGDTVPFYAFYKAIGTSENGNVTYAKTYVPAIEVSNLEAYFRDQKQSHISRPTEPTQ